MNSKLNNFRHSNHLPVNHIHLSISLSAIPDTVLDEVKFDLQSGVTSTAIINKVRQSHLFINISMEQVSLLRKKIIDDHVSNAGDDPSISAAERLIKLFKCYEDVSYIYVKHKTDTGFVTYTKDRGSTMESLQHQQLSHNVTDAATSDDVELWRQELKLGDNNEILVAFAWSQSEETRKLSMFPEFIAADLTFGVNRQKRSLFVVSGVDGNNKRLTGFRAFMPAKTKQAYLWSLHVALPFLIGQSSVDLILCISTDDEKALLQAIDE